VSNTWLLKKYISLLKVSYNETMTFSCSLGKEEEHKVHVLACACACACSSISQQLVYCRLYL